MLYFLVAQIQNSKSTPLAPAVTTQQNLYVSTNLSRTGTGIRIERLYSMYRAYQRYRHAYFQDISVYSSGDQDLSHETLGTETVESHQEPGVGINENTDEMHEQTANKVKEIGTNEKLMIKQKNNKDGQD